MLIYRLLSKTIFRFLSVGIISEILYLLFFLLLTNVNFKSDLAVLISGSICIILTSFLHAKVTFRTKYNMKFLTKYFIIQITCMFSSYLLSLQLIRLNISDSYIGFITMASWALLSYFLCRLSYKNNTLI